jgi:hypothetical protein
LDINSFFHAITLLKSTFIYPSPLLREAHPDGVYIDLIDHQADYYSPSLQPKMSKAGFLDSLPKHVIKNGQLINVRESIDDLLSSKPAAPINILAGSAVGAEVKDPCLVNVRWSEGNKQVVITISKHGTVSELRDLIRTHFAPISEAKSRPVEVELRTSFPSRILDDG